MSDSDDNLLQQLGGVASPGGDLPSSRESSEEQVTAIQSTEQQDHWRMMLVDLVYLLNGTFRDVHYWEGVKSDKDNIKDLVKILHELQQMPGNDGSIRIEHRGRPGTKVSEKTDYIIRFGDLVVDASTVSTVIKRIGIRVKHIEGRLIKSFEAFSNQGLGTIFIKIPDASDESLEKIRVCMRIISCFKKAVEDGGSIDYVKTGQELSLKPVLNESGQPDPNLTQLAALNDLNAQNMQEMIQKVAALMKRPDFARTGQSSANVYQTIFSIKSLRQRLARPPIELNSERPPEGAKNQQGEAGGARGPAGVSGPAVRMDPAALKASVAKYVKEAYGDSPEKAVEVMKTIYGKDYSQLDLSGLEGRLRLITDLLGTLDGSDNGRELLENVLDRLQAGMDQLPRDVLDDLIVDGDEIKVWEEDGEKVIGKSDDHVSNLIDTAKDRLAARKKIRTVLNVDGQFTDQDYEQLSKTFKISYQEAEKVALLVKRCFDDHGNFQRALFEKNVAALAQHPKKIFEILWEFLKEIPRRSDRLPFLNSLQLLVKELNQPKQASKILVSDFIINPGDVIYPDRNALMLAIQFSRTYNREINVDIEITPEEVLQVNKGLDQGVTRYLAWKIDGEQKRFVEKIVTIRKKLIQSFEQEGSDAGVLPIRFLLALEREAHIFLALVGGKIATTVIQGALNVYGNPASQIYLLRESPNYMSSLLQHLGILIRGAGRVGHESDFDLLDEIKKRLQGFINLSDEPRQQALVRRTLGAVDAAKQAIGKRASGSS